MKILSAINNFCDRMLSFVFIEFFPLTLCVINIALLFSVIFLILCAVVFLILHAFVLGVIGFV